MGLHDEAMKLTLWLQKHSHDVYGPDHKYSVDALEVL